MNIYIFNLDIINVLKGEQQLNHCGNFTSLQDPGGIHLYWWRVRNHDIPNKIQAVVHGRGYPIRSSQGISHSNRKITK